MELVFIVSTLTLTVCVMLLTKRRILIESFAVIASLITCIEAFVIALKVSHTGMYTSSIFFSVDSFGVDAALHYQ